MLPRGSIGELCIGGVGVARGYHGQQGLTEERFLPNPFRPGETLYRTGDLAYWDPTHCLRYLGRSDHQIKIRGVRIETAEIEAALGRHPDITDSVVGLIEPATPAQADRFCQRCGIEARHPDARLDEQDLCAICHDYEDKENLARQYFGRTADLHGIIARIQAERTGRHDCVMLLSGGKDSTYALCQIVEMGLRPLAFTLDNGFISEGAKANVQRVVDQLGVELVIGQTPSMNEIFADSLNRFSNVCHGCFKTIYTMSINLAKARGLKYIVTGLSRGQIYETRLASLFQQRFDDARSIDHTIIEARKAYHRMDDAVSRCLDVSLFADDAVFHEIEFVDFYRYNDATLDEIMAYLSQRAPWIRPADTGRSTNCLINEVGIHVHQLERRYHNYSLPYSWDVRLGHKDRDAAREELDDNIDRARVNAILDQINYQPNAAFDDADGVRLAAWYVANRDLTTEEIRDWLKQHLPSEYLPSAFVPMAALPLTPNDKIDRDRLPVPADGRPNISAPFVAPSNATEALLSGIWAKVLGIDQVGIDDNFFDLGGDSILNIQIVTQARASGLALTPQELFDHPTVAALAQVVQPANQVVAAEQGPVIGSCQLLPTQLAWLEQTPSVRSCFAQSMLFDLSTSPTEDIVVAALGDLINHHDGLRARLEKSDQDEWQWMLTDIDSVTVSVGREAIGHYSRHEQERIVTERAERLSETLDPTQGPMMRAFVFHRGDGFSPQLLLVIHHLVVDGVSWWTLRNDLGAAIVARTQNVPPSFPQKTASIRQWAGALRCYATEAPLTKELPYWQAQLATNAVSPRTTAATPSHRFTRHLKLGVELTTPLLRALSLSHKAQMPDVLLTALTLALANARGERRVAVAMEGHGREDIGAGLDLVSTVGWLTTVYPVSLQVDPAATTLAHLRFVRSQLRAIPQQGLGYGVLRYLSPEPHIQASLQRQRWPDILFNYLGQWAAEDEISGGLRFARPVALHRDPAFSEYTLEVAAVIFEGGLSITLEFSSDAFSTQTADAIVKQIQEHLVTLSEAVSTGEPAKSEQPDVRHADLDTEQLKALLAEFDEDED